MTPDPTCSLPAIRERAQAWQEEQAAAAACGWKWTGPPEVPGLWEEVAFLLALVARLQGERDSARAALRGLEAGALDDGPCWCEYPPKDPEGHGPYCRAARAALGEEADG